MNASRFALVAALLLSLAAGHLVDSSTLRAYAFWCRQSDKGSILEEEPNDDCETVQELGPLVSDEPYVVLGSSDPVADIFDFYGFTSGAGFITITLYCEDDLDLWIGYCEGGEFFYIAASATYDCPEVIGGYFDDTYHWELLVSGDWAAAPNDYTLTIDWIACTDVDGDGFIDKECGGDDCDDTDPTINPDAEEDCYDEIDNDCDGLVDEEDPECDFITTTTIVTPTTTTTTSTTTTTIPQQYEYVSVIAIPRDETGAQRILGGIDVVIEWDKNFAVVIDYAPTSGWIYNATDPETWDTGDVRISAVRMSGEPGDVHIGDLYFQIVGTGDAALTYTLEVLCTSIDDYFEIITEYSSVELVPDSLLYLLCWDDDADGYYDEECGGTDCDDMNPAVNPGTDEICIGGIDEDCDDLIDAEDPDCPAAEFVIVLDAFHFAGILRLNFVIGAPEPSTWITFMILTSPTIQIIPLWAGPLPKINPPVEFPVTFPLSSVGLAGFYTRLSTEEGKQASDFDWVIADW